MLWGNASLRESGVGPVGRQLVASGAAERARAQQARGGPALSASPAPHLERAPTPRAPHSSRHPTPRTLRPPGHPTQGTPFPGCSAHLRRPRGVEAEVGDGGASLHCVSSLATSEGKAGGEPSSSTLVTVLPMVNQSLIWSTVSWRSMLAAASTAWSDWREKPRGTDGGSRSRSPAPHAALGQSGVRGRGRRVAPASPARSLLGASQGRLARGLLGQPESPAEGGGGQGSRCVVVGLWGQDV